MVRVYDTDSILDVIKKIWEHFEINQSCAIYGFIMHEKESRLVPKGQVIIEELEKLDRMEHFRGEKERRRFVYRKDSIGGPLAHKIFTYEKRVVDNEPRYTIWRYQ